MEFPTGSQTPAKRIRTESPSQETEKTQTGITVEKTDATTSQIVRAKDISAQPSTSSMSEMVVTATEQPSTSKQVEEEPIHWESLLDEVKHTLKRTDSKMVHRLSVILDTPKSLCELFIGEHKEVLALNKFVEPLLTSSDNVDVQKENLSIVINALFNEKMGKSFDWKSLWLDIPIEGKEDTFLESTTLEGMSLLAVLQCYLNFATNKQTKVMSVFKSNEPDCHLCLKKLADERYSHFSRTLKECTQQQKLLVRLLLDSIAGLLPDESLKWHNMSDNLLVSNMHLPYFEECKSIDDICHLYTPIRKSLKRIGKLATQKTPTEKESFINAQKDMDKIKAALQRISDTLRDDRKIFEDASIDADEALNICESIQSRILTSLNHFADKRWLLGCLTIDPIQLDDLHELFKRSGRYKKVYKECIGARQVGETRQTSVAATVPGRTRATSESKQ